MSTEFFAFIQLEDAQSTRWAVLHSRHFRGGWNIVELWSPSARWSRRFRLKANADGIAKGHRFTTRAEALKAAKTESPDRRVRVQAVAVGADGN